MQKTKSQIRQLKSNKLFYGKWPYKLECLVSGASKITNLGLNYADAWCKGKWNPPYEVDRYKQVSKSELAKFIAVYEPYAQENIKVRAEGKHFNIFCADKDLLDKMIKDFKDWVVSITSPETQEELEFLLDSKNKKVLCDAYPKGEYKYKITIRERTSLDTRTKFLEWLNKYPDKTNVSKQTLKWLKGEIMYKQDPFFYTKDGPMLTMCMLFLGDNANKVYEYVLRNTVIKE